MGNALIFAFPGDFNMHCARFHLPFLLLPVAIGLSSPGCSNKPSGSGGEPSDSGTQSPDSGVPDSGVKDSEFDPNIALLEDFENWSGGRGFYLTRGEALADNGTTTEIDGRTCLLISGQAADNSGHGFSVEAEFLLDRETDMSNSDYVVSFDVFVPPETHQLGANVQFSLWSPADTPIYSVWYSGSIISGTWVSLEAPINTTDGLISYSAFQNNPDDWVFDAFRVQTIINSSNARLGDEVRFCLDNIKIEKIPKEPTETPDMEIDLGVTTESPFQVTIDGEEHEVLRVNKFEVPVNYVWLEHAGDVMNVSVTADTPLDATTLSPESLGLESNVEQGALVFDVAEPASVVLMSPNHELLFLLFDPPEDGAPALGDPDVIDASELAGVDPTGETESTEALQAAIDRASGAEQHVLYVPPGVYATRALYLKDDMTLYLARGALLFNITPQEEVLPNVPGLTVIEGASHGFIVFDGVQNAKLRGRGTIDVRGVSLKSYGRKMFAIKMENSSSCVVEGILSRDSSFWNTLVYRSDDIVIENFKVINHVLAEGWNETDGVDFDNSTNSRLTGAFLYTGDDCMSTKSDDIPDDFAIDGILDPSTGPYRAVADITHESVVCISGSAACKVGTKTFGETMSNIVFRDIDVVSANRALAIDAVDTANIVGTVFEDIRIEAVSGRIADFNMDPAAITWRTNPGTCTVTDTSLIDVVSHVNAQIALRGNVHDWDPEDPHYGNEYFIDGVTFQNLIVQGNQITSLDDPNGRFSVNPYVRNVVFVP